VHMEHGGSLTRTWALIGLGCALMLAQPANGQVPPSADNVIGIPDLSRIAPVATDRQGVSSTLQIFVILTVLTLVPSILVMMTCFTRIIIVLGLMRQAMATPQLPPSQVLLGLSLFLTFLVMTPTWQRVHQDAIRPYLDNEPQMTQRKALEVSTGHLREFMFAQIENVGNEEDIYMFLEYARKRPIGRDEEILREDVPTTVLIPAYILSELKTAFVMGFRVYLPFLVIDMVIASVLISMGMLMLPPVLISLPFKIMLFVLADGWHLVVGSLLESFV
jgi:flagellar biosynthesis protein FliP